MLVRACSSYLQLIYIILAFLKSRIKAFMDSSHALFIYKLALAENSHTMVASCSPNGIKDSSLL